MRTGTKHLEETVLRRGQNVAVSYRVTATRVTQPWKREAQSRDVLDKVLELFRKASLLLCKAVLKMPPRTTHMLLDTCIYNKDTPGQLMGREESVLEDRIATKQEWIGRDRSP